LRSRDPLQPPLIDPGYLSDEGDLRVLLHGVRLARRLLATSALKPLVLDELLPGAEAQTDDELVAVVRAKAHTLYHPVGTCALGTVVDAELRVRGVEGLRVADASVIPRVPRGHTNWPTVAVAEKAADLIRAS
jgi:choline dehydrogenase